MTGLAVVDPTKAGAKRQDLATKLRRLIVGHEEGIREIVKTCRARVVGLSPDGRPLGNFLFLGSGGSGRTSVVEATAQSLLKYAQRVIKIDCAAPYQGPEITNLIRSPLEHLSQQRMSMRDTGATEVSIVLFDEIEKASDVLWSLLLDTLQRPALTLGNNRTANLSNTMVLLTSNIGVNEMSSAVKLADVRRSRIAAAADRRRFTPEFIDRLERIVVFEPSGPRIQSIEHMSFARRIYRRESVCTVPAWSTACQAAA